jgi:hypothetical protein
MGVVLIGGFFFVIATLIFKLNKPSASCESLTMPIASTANIQFIEANGDTISWLETSVDGKREVHRMDGCTGKELPLITLEIK